jgi:hypothetical protein
MSDSLKRSLISLAITVGGLAIGGALYGLQGHALIRSIYEGRSWGVLNRLISGQAEYGLDTYYHKGDRYIIWYSVLIILTVLFAQPLAQIFRAWSHHVALSPRKLFGGMAVILGAWFLLSALFDQPAMYDLKADYWEHAAVIKEWSSNIWSPQDPFLSLDNPSMRFIPSYFVVAGIAGIFNLTAFQALGLGGLLNLGLLLAGIYLFTKAYFKSEWAPVWGLVILLTSWGAVLPRSGFYQLRCLFFVVSYPSVFVFAIALITLWLAVKILRRQFTSFWGYFALVVLPPMMLISHITFGAFALISVCLLAIFEPGIARSLRFKVLLSVSSGIFLPLLWPYFSLGRMILRLLSYQKYWSKLPTSYYHLKSVLQILGPAVLGIPAVFYAAYKRKNGFLISGFLVMVLLLAMGVIFSVPTGERFLIFAAFFLQLALIWAILEGKASSPRPFLSSTYRRFLQKGLHSLLALFFGWNITVAIFEFTGLPVQLFHQVPYHYPYLAESHRMISDLRRLASFIPERAVVMAPDNISRLLPAFSGKVVGARRGGFFVSFEDRNRRYTDNQKVYSAKTSPLEREELLKRYGVSYLLFDREQTSPGLMNELIKLGKPIGGTLKLLLIELS